MKKTMKKCVECKEKIEDYNEQDGNVYCITCYDEKYACCEECSEIKNKNEISYKDETYICKSCFDRLYSLCDFCDEYKREENCSYDESDKVCCEDCRYDIYRCDSCGYFVHSDDTYSCDNCERIFCEDCYYNNHSECGIYDNDKTLDKIPSADTNKSDTKGYYCGIELEVLATAELNRNKDEFKCVEDGSIASGCDGDEDGYGEGCEFVSAPLQNDAFERVVKPFVTKNSARCYVNRTCGYHLHIGLKPHQIDNATFYKKVLYFGLNNELLFLQTQPRSRYGGTYSEFLNDFTCRKPKKPLDTCVKTRRTDTFLHYFYRRRTNTLTKEKYMERYGNYSKYLQSLKQTSKYSSSANRYFWINLHATSLYNTIEIRLHSGTFNYNKIKAWALLWTRIFNWLDKQKLSAIKEMKFESFEKMLKTMKINAVKVVGNETLHTHFKRRIEQHREAYEKFIKDWELDIPDDEYIARVNMISYFNEVEKAIRQWWSHYRRNSERIGVTFPIATIGDTI